MHRQRPTRQCDQRGTCEPCGPQANLGGLSQFYSLERVLLLELKSASTTESDFYNIGALRMMMARLDTAVAHAGFGHDDRVGRTSALERTYY